VAYLSVKNRIAVTLCFFLSLGAFFLPWQRQIMQWRMSDAGQTLTPVLDYFNGFAVSAGRIPVWSCLILLAINVILAWRPLFSRIKCAILAVGLNALAITVVVFSNSGLTGAKLCGIILAVSQLIWAFEAKNAAKIAERTTPENLGKKS